MYRDSGKLVIRQSLRNIGFWIEMEDNRSGFERYYPGNLFALYYPLVSRLLVPSTLFRREGLVSESRVPTVSNTHLRDSDCSFDVSHPLGLDGITSEEYPKLRHGFETIHLSCLLSSVDLIFALFPYTYDVIIPFDN
ncbi:hypothetical protein Tco_0597021 [Tanacetum coccineum]